CLSGSSRMLAISRQREPRPVTHLTCLATGELSVRARPSAGGYEQDAGFASLTDLWHEVHTILGRVSSQSVGCKRRRSNHHRFLGPTPLGGRIRLAHPTHDSVSARLLSLKMST